MRILRAGLPESFKRCSPCELSIRFCHEGRLYSVFDQAKWALGGGGNRKNVLNVVRLQAQPQQDDVTNVTMPVPTSQPQVPMQQFDDIPLPVSQPARRIQPIKLDLSEQPQDQYIALLQQQLQRQSQPQQTSVELLQQLLQQQCCPSPLFESIEVPSSDDDYSSGASTPNDGCFSPQPIENLLGGLLQHQPIFDNPTDRTFPCIFESQPTADYTSDDSQKDEEFMDSETFFSYFGEEPDDEEGDETFYRSCGGSSFRYNCASPPPAMAPRSPFFRGIALDAESEDFSLLTASSSSLCFEHNNIKYYIMQCNTQIIISNRNNNNKNKILTLPIPPVPC